MNSKFRVAIIGLGKQSRDGYLPGILNSQFAELVAVCDKNKSLLKEVANEYNVRGYTDCAKLLKRESVDFAVVVVTHDAYAEVLVELTSHGVHVLKEKPLGRNLKEAFILSDSIRKNNVECMITLQRRFNPIFASFFQFKDQIGRPYHVECKSTMFLEKPQSGWRESLEKAGGGVILDLGYHMIDLIIWYFGLPDSVYSDFNVNKDISTDHQVEDMGVVLFSYENGFHGSLFVSSFSPPKEQSMRLTGSKGILELNGTSVSRLNNKGEVLEKLVREKSQPSTSTEQIDYFCRVIKKERKNYGRAEDHMEHMAFIEAIYKSKSEKRAVSPRQLLEVLC